MCLEDQLYFEDKTSINIEKTKIQKSIIFKLIY